MKIGLKYKNEEHIFDECISAGVPFLKYPILEKEGLVEHGISTRLGGVSEGFLGSMNLSYTRGDDPAHVDENYRRMAAAIGVKPEHMVCTHQTHTDRDKRRCRQRCYKRKRLHRCRWTDHKCTGNLSGDILRGLCTASVSGSGEKGGSIQPFRLERHCEPDGTGDG